MLQYAKIFHCKRAISMLDSTNNTNHTMINFNDINLIRLIVIINIIYIYLLNSFTTCNAKDTNAQCTRIRTPNTAISSSVVASSVQTLTSISSVVEEGRTA